jgi:RNA polymerase sigma-70 factor, ECF subfamily
VRQPYYRNFAIFLEIHPRFTTFAHQTNSGSINIRLVAPQSAQSVSLNTTDEQILAEFQASGDVAILGTLVERHLERVRNLAYQLVLCHATADDVAQEVFLKVMRSVHSFRGEAKFSTWLYQITVNAAREHLRRRAPSDMLSDFDAPTPEGGDQQADSNLIRSELVATIEDALCALSDKLRTAIVLTAIEGLAPKTAAEIEGCSVATMHWRIHEARKKLKPLLHRHVRS